MFQSGNVVYQSGNENGGWCVEGIAHGTYEMHAQLLDKKFRNVITEIQRNIYILPTVNVENMETFLSSDAVVIGAEKQVSVNGYFAYKGNIDENVKIKTTVSKNGEIFDENEIECRVNSDKEECEINLINFVPDTTEVATYKIKSSLVYGENEISSCEKQFHVLAKEPNTTVEYSQGNFEPPLPQDYHYNGPIPEFTNHTEQKIVEYLRTIYNQMFQEKLKLFQKENFVIIVEFWWICLKKNFRI